jgi:hypothetical protein
MKTLIDFGMRVIPFLPFVILAIAVIVAIYHIKVYW